MMNINFFEKKKINLLPYIIAGFFVIFLAVIGIYLFVTRNNYQNVIEKNNNWLTVNSENVVLSRQISQVDNLINESEVTQEILKENQYPMYDLTTDLASAVPNEDERIVGFSLLEPILVTLILENIEPNEAQAIVEDIEGKVYVELVDFMSATTQDDEEAAMRFELTIQINADNLMEEETE